MILHLQAAGVPVSWSITALYKDSYGVAHAAAKHWYDCMSADPDGEHDSPQYVCDVVGDDQKGYTIKRDDLFMGRRHLVRQVPDDSSWLVQAQTSPVPLSITLLDVLTEALRAKLVAFGYLLPRAEWMRRYPADVMVAKRFAEFNAAYDAHCRADPKADIPFELKWAPFMERPHGFVFPFDVAAQPTGWAVTDRGSPMLDFELTAEDEARIRMRLLNSGWSPDEVKILLSAQPVD